MALKISHVAPARAIPSIVDDFRAGMLTPPRVMPPKYFYDQHGATLFDQICEVPEYYPTRTERAILREHASWILKHTLPEVILELGSGSSSKTRELFDACTGLDLRPQYWPFDVSEQMLLDSAKALHKDYDWLNLHVLTGDYSGGLAHLPDPGAPTLALFLGGTIGNFAPTEASEFLSELNSHLQSGDFLLIGMDMVKFPNTLEAAYDDAQGLTAQFNLNLLNVLNRELGANFELSGFKHIARYNTGQAQIEMYLESLTEQKVQIGALEEEIRLHAGERILTEISRKFDTRSIRALLASSGFREVEILMPDNGYFALVLGEVI